MLIYSIYTEKYKNPADHHLIPFLEWLVKENIITEETLNKVYMTYIIDQRSKRVETIKRWVEEDSVIWQMIR